MQDSRESLVRGRTRWRRFAALMLPATAVAGAVVFGMANGAIAASFAVSGQTFKVSASKLEADGFKQYGGLATENGGDPQNPADPKNHPVAVSSIDEAKLTDLCQSVKVPGMPVVLTINAGGNGTPAQATNMLIDMDSLQGDATFTDIQIGRDAGDLGGQPGQFGQSAKRVVITDLKQVARSTSAGTFTLTGLSLAIKTGSDARECF